MNLPRRWLLGRPGFCIPVFFLSLCQGWTREFPAEATIQALGGTYLARSLSHCAGYNQAALGWLEDGSISMHQAQPFLLPETGISSLAVSTPLGNGGFGSTLSTYGITGFRHLSAWFSYGLRISTEISAGAGLYFRDRIIREYGHHPGIGCALGLQARLQKSLILGIHIRHPVAWPERGNLQSDMPLTLGAGLAYSFFQTASCYLDLRFSADQGAICAGGLEIPLTHWITLMAGFQSQVWTFAGGFLLSRSRWTLALAYSFCYENGSIPSCSLAWQW